jgi:anti-sigma regulatory factor (Ser/Thr protein kinase)
MGRAVAEEATEGRVADSMQRALLPILPDVPEFRLAGRYVPAEGPATGGDWYDAIPLPDARLGVVIGDVTRRGPRGIAQMARLQTLIRAYALEAAAPEFVLARVNAHLFELSDDGMATVLYAVVDPEDRTIDVASAGHPPPLRVDPDIGTSYWDISPGPPLGVTRGATYQGRIGPLGDRGTLLLYTNGLFSLPDAPLARGLEALRRTAEEGSSEPGQLCDRILESLVPEPPPRDDVALLAVQVEPARDSLALSLPAKPASLGTMRRALTHWMRHTGGAQNETYEVVVACGEACANAVAHAYPPVHDGGVEINARKSGDAVEITVSDRGRWRGADSAENGRGLALMRDLMDAVEIDTRPDGTRVTMRRRLARPRR